MDFFDIDAGLEPRDQEQSVARVRLGHHRASQHGLDVIERVVALPGQPIGAVPFLGRHARMRGADVIEIVLVHVPIHLHAFAMQHLMVFRSRQRREEEELQHVDWQLFLDDLDVAADGLDVVLGKAEDVAGVGEDTGLFPSQ